MKYYVRFPSEENIDTFYSHSAQFEATLIVEAIRNMDMSNSDKKKTVENVLDYLKSNPH